MLFCTILNFIRLFFFTYVLLFHSAYIIKKMYWPIISLIFVAEKLCLCRTATSDCPLSFPRKVYETGVARQKLSKGNLSHCHFIHHKDHMDCPRHETGPSQSEGDV
jgi:hypothetical protein